MSLSSLSSGSRSASVLAEPPIIQPDHFYSSANEKPLSPPQNGLLDPEQDKYATRGIPVFKPSMDQFQDFEAYMKQIEPWGMKSGIVKVIPPKEWRDSLPDVKHELPNVKITSPIEQNMAGSGGKFRQDNIVRRKEMSVREWVNLCNKDEFKAPAVHQVGLFARGTILPTKNRTRASRSRDTPTVHVKAEESEDISHLPHASTSTPAPSTKRKHTVAEKSKLESDFIESFNPSTDWLPTHTTADDYSPEFCTQLERHYWRNLGLGKPPWYGADSQGSLFDSSVTSWNVATLPSALTRLLPSSSQGLPGVNTPYLYFGMWRATFAWHVEDMDLSSINYIHFGAPKFWYAMPQARARSLEHTMRGFFPSEPSSCSQFLRHKSFLVSPNVLAQNGCGKPNTCVQQEGEFMITYPFGYHAGFNLGLNCAESVNFALDSWIPIGRKAKICQCVSDSVRIDVDQLINDRAIERGELPPHDIDDEMIDEIYEESEVPVTNKRAQKVRNNVTDLNSTAGTKRKASGESSQTAKKARVSAKLKSAAPSGLKFTLPAQEDVEFPCCLCVSLSREGLLPVFDPPAGRKEAADTERNLPSKHNRKEWMAHEECAKIIPETWVDEVDDPRIGYLGQPSTSDYPKIKMVFGVDSIVKDRWALKCILCPMARHKSHGAPIQCTKGKCPKAFHVNCAKEASQPTVDHEDGSMSAGGDTVFEIAQILEKEIILLDNSSAPDPMLQGDSTSDPEAQQDAGRVLKTIQKYEIKLLCAQHNPVVASRKKALKQTRVRDLLLGLAPYSRIKIRVSSGVFEVTLVRVLADTGSVEVLWDERGVTREFKWGSVVWGDCHGVEIKMGPTTIVKPERHVPTPPPSSYPVYTYPPPPAPDGHSNQGRYGQGYYPGEPYSSKPTAGPSNSHTSTSSSFYAPGGVLQLAPLTPWTTTPSIPQPQPQFQPAIPPVAPDYNPSGAQDSSGEYQYTNMECPAAAETTSRPAQSDSNSAPSPAELTHDRSCSPSSSSTPPTPSAECSLPQDLTGVSGMEKNAETRGESVHVMGVGGQ